MDQVSARAHDLSIDIGDVQTNFILRNGFFDIDAEWVARSHFHTCFEIHYILDGSSELIVDDNPYLLEKGDCCIIAPGKNHYTKAIFEPTKKVSFLFNFRNRKGYHVEAVGGQMAFYRAFLDIDPILILKNNDIYQKYLSEILVLMNQADIFKPYKTGAMFTLMILDVADQLLGGTPQETPPSPDEPPSARQDAVTMENLRLLRIEDYINKNYRRNLTLSDLAAHLHLSERQTVRSVQKLTGLGFGQFLLKVRLDRAKELLLSTDISIQEIAHRVGYHSYNGFYSAFKKCFGISPNCLREQQPESETGQPSGRNWNYEEEMDGE